jgi:soluble lytic murein transglycosylase
VCLVALAAACGGQEAARPPAIVAPSVQVKEASSKARAAEVPPLRVVLADPRFAAVAERVKDRDALGAALSFEEVRSAALTGADASWTCAVEYLGGRLHRDAGQDESAAQAFDRVGHDCALAPYAVFHASEAHARLGRADDAIDRARKVPDDVAVAAEAHLVEAEALAAKGERPAALALWRAHLAKSAHGARWVDTCVKIATALLDGVDGDPTAHAHDALDLATRVVVEAPKLADVSGAQAARDRAIAVLRVSDPKLSDELSPAEHARRAQAWLDAGEPAKAIDEAALVTSAPGGSSAGPVSCHAATVRAQALAKTRGAAVAAADAYTDAIARCAGDESLPGVLFAGAKASLGAKRPDEAVARFAEVEALFPHHRLADDARLRTAMIARDTGDLARAESLLSSLPDDYPEGDERGEALFRVALARMTRGDWSAAKEPLERAAATDVADHRGVNGGRAAYFRARASAMTGDADDARARYEAVISQWPLTYAMAQAYEHLAAIDPARARRALDGAIAGESGAGRAPVDHDELHTAAFERGRALLEVGEIDDARREMARAVTDGTDPEVLWTVALLYERAGAPDVAESLVGAKLGDFAAHWPAGPWRSRWEIAYPRPFDDLVERASAASKVPPVLTWAIMRQESGFAPDAKSPSDAYGLMQIIVPTARGLVRGTGFGADPESLKRPEVSITLGAKLLGSLRASYPDNRALAIAAYNGGGGAVGRWLAARAHEDFDLWVEEIPFDETRGYIKRVLANEASYAFLYAPESLDEVLTLPERVTR